MTAAAHDVGRERRFISVVVPIYNEAAYVERCAQALLGQDYPRDRYEILMVDNNSTDGSYEIASGIDGIRVLREEVQGDYAARNLGIASAQGEIIAFTDSDTAPFPDWLDSIEKEMAAEPCTAVIVGGLNFSGSSRVLGLLAAYEADKSRYIFQGDDPHLYYGYTCNLAARRRVFEELGAFAPIQRNADVVFVQKVVRACSPKAVVYRPQVGVQRLEIRSFGDFVRKQWIYGTDFPRYARVTSVRPLSMSERMSIFRCVVERRKFRLLDVGLLGAALAIGALSYDFGRWVARRRSDEQAPPRTRHG